ncbi:hypothetical protein [Paraburkholderia sp. C35]|uniref:hypothetical protein n=1 Tax=Paraburkholderia sp. C35 TaxID=2126993 RepID=UPI000D6893EC|nr:hypothetical protein [Paraburkholderia sp. C35]
MQSTTQTRLRLSSHDARTLDEMAALYGTMKRKLYARIAANGGKTKSHKTAFCREHGISARMFNAIAIDLQGLLDGTHELMVSERKDLLRAIRNQQRQLDTRRARLDETQDVATIITSSRCECRTACARRASANTSSSAMWYSITTAPRRMRRWPRMSP